MFHRIYSLFASMKMALFLLSYLFILVLLGTLEQTESGVYYAQNKYFRSFFITHQGVLYPPFLGGYTIGFLLFISLTQIAIKSFFKRSFGLFFIHIGLIILILSEVVAAFFTEEMQIVLPLNQKKNFAQSKRSFELLLKKEHPFDHEYVVIDFSSLYEGQEFRIKDHPLIFRIHRIYQNSEIKDQQSLIKKEKGLVGTARELQAVFAPLEKKDEDKDHPSLYLEVLKLNGKSLGCYLVSSHIPFEEPILVEGSYTLSLKEKKCYLDYSFELNQFVHEKHPGTEIPKHFASFITLYDDQSRVVREVSISMNQPLYLQGMTFYQASYAKDDQISILHVVKNPGKELPYLSSLLVSLGLFVQFFDHFLKMKKRKS